MKEKNEEKTVVKVEKVVFSKEQIVNSKKYANRRDLLGALLENGKKYTFEQVDAIIDKVMKGKVK